MLLGLSLAAAIPLSGCTTSRPEPVAPVSTLRLVAFDSCDQLLTDLRKAATDAVGPWGFPGGNGGYAADSADLRVPSSATAERAAPGPAFSGTNNHEADADEPDIVKTDGRRIVTVQDGVLRVVDAAAHRRTGKLDLGVRGAETNLLLSGDHALVLVRSGFGGGPAIDRIRVAIEQPEVLLVDLSGPPKLLSRFRGEGTLVDARQTGSVARIVLRTPPKIRLPERGDISDRKRLAANRAALAKAGLDTWLPEWSVTTNGSTTKGRVGCDRVSRPAVFSGTSMVTVLTFDLAAAALNDGDPMSVAADADTVYGTANSLYLAADQRWRFNVWPGPMARPAILPEAQRTEIYRLALSGTARPSFAASGTVPGFLVNQYALSEWDGHLRVATTSGDPGDGESWLNRSASAAPSSSAIRILTQQGGALTQTGVVDGLGKGERIYSVRFIGPRGYVVTFKQTDPLYTVDLSNPAKPTVTGELTITGYSAHLQPAGDGRLIGIGQEANAAGRTQGTQVSLFDIADPANPRRLAQHQVAGGESQAEWDPHALLYWPATQLLVVPVTRFDPTGAAAPAESALALRVTDAGLTEVGTITQPRVGGSAPTVRRTLVTGTLLWTLSDLGLQASDLSTMGRIAWLPN
jgi:uncharacterized secreted protein with C-terminal beta-propeller domain